MIIVSITGPETSAALRQIHASAKHADAFELRLDMIPGADVRMLCRASRKPVIAACRPVQEGGCYAGEETDRLALLVAAREAGARYLDIEIGAAARLFRRLPSLRTGRGLIVSHHQHSGPVRGIDALYRRLRGTGAEVIKWAYAAEDASDIAHACEMYALARADRQKCVAIAMGEGGEASRVLYRKLGGWGTYAAPEEGLAAAPGQVTAQMLRRVYAAHTLGPDTRVFGVVGFPLRQSKGVFVHNALFQHARIDAVYCRFPVTRLARFMERIGPLLAGFSVTLPHKEAVVRYLAGVDRVASAIGAVNTVIRRHGGFYGTNTDAPGALDALEEAAPVRGKRLLILGAGGAARAVAYEARRRGAAVDVTNRTAAKGRRLAKALGVRFVAQPEVTAYDVLVNTTPVGMAPGFDLSPIASEQIREGMVVFDAVYNPRETRLLRDARARNAVPVSGALMYLNQGALQWELFTGRMPDRARMERILRAKV